VSKSKELKALETERKRLREIADKCKQEFLDAHKQSEIARQYTECRNVDLIRANLMWSLNENKIIELKRNGEKPHE
jgi:hypothetical protein